MKIQLADFVKYGKLFDIYGKLLSEDRQIIMNLYFNFNMTLVEIARERNISRQAVLDSLRKSCDKLSGFENILGFAKKQESLNTKLEEIKLLANDAKANEISLKVEEILGEI